MTEDPLDYGKMMQKALKDLMAEALGYVAEHGLPGDHHFYITFHTSDPEVEMPDWLRKQYPSELTIVLQHEFFDLAVVQKRFSVKLSFNDQLATLVVPFSAVKTFADPSAEFGLRFDPQLSDYEGQDTAPASSKKDVKKLDVTKKKLDIGKKKDGAQEKESVTAEIVSLDTFRKP